MVCASTITQFCLRARLSAVPYQTHISLRLQPNVVPPACEYASEANGGEDFQSVGRTVTSQFQCRIQLLVLTLQNG
jgi:hypothetical protein